MKSICFKCKFVGIGLQDSCCPGCGFPLIVNTAAVGLDTHDIEEAFSLRVGSAPLPGVNPEPRSAQLLAARRKERARRILEQRKQTARRKARRRIAGEVAAASAFLAGLLVTLTALGAL
jgi:hypothetical protein